MKWSLPMPKKRKKYKPPQVVTSESYLSGIMLCSTCGNAVVAGLPNVTICSDCYETRSSANYLDEEKELEDD